MFATGPNLMQRQRSGSMQGEAGSVCVSNFGVCVGRGKGKGFVSYDLRYRPSHSYKVDAASRAGRLGSFSYVSI